MEALNNPTRTNQKFAHALRFNCPSCGKSISAMRFSENMSREMIAPLLFHQRCDCGWEGQLAGLAATRHAVTFATAFAESDPANKSGSGTHGQ
jgi:predicted RNA-binding Zn-ribbon protein involved in translation (DUF1610 family)